MGGEKAENMRRSTERRMFFIAALICPYFLNVKPP